ncbi:hypothetical protein [Dyella sp. 20L07]|uniref:hypothetical protein n=1 Tax=Dyella sp. 20L07 TaxID=3384240 RepID=UPI003D2E623F
MSIIGGLVMGGVPVAFSLFARAGYQNALILLNDAMKPAVQSRDLEQVLRIGREAINAAARTPTNPISPL